MTPETSFWWNWWVSAAAAGATFLAVLVALFGQAFRGKFFPPKLGLRLLDPKGEKAVARLAWVENGEVKERMEDCRYYHLQVSNSRRWSPAHEVQVVLLRLEEPAPQGGWKVEWTGAIPLGWRHQQLYSTSRTVGALADVDLCSVIKNKWLALHPLITPFNLKVQRREPCVLCLTIQAQSSECDSRPIRVKVAWDGKWHDGAQEMIGHLSVEVLDEPAL